MSVAKTRPAVGWLAAARFAGLVTAVGSAATAVILGVGAMVSPPPDYVIAQVAGALALIAFLATALHIPWLALRPPRSRWGVLSRAVIVSYVAVGAAGFVIGLISVPWIALQIVPVALLAFTVFGAFLVPAAVAALLAPLLDSRLRRWRATPPTAPSTGPSAPPP